MSINKTQVSIGADIGGSHISCVGVNLVDQSIIEGSLSRVKIDHLETPENILSAWATAINGTIECMDDISLSGIGFSIPGPFDYHAGISKMEHKFPQLKDIHLPSCLGPLLTTDKSVEMRFLNDAVAFAVGEAWIGAGKDAQKVVVITLGTGFGSAYIDKGIPVVGREDVAPQGCFWHLPYREGIADDYFSTRWFVNSYKDKTGKSVAGVKEIAEVVHSDNEANELFQSFGENMADFIGPWLKKFEAETLIMGGNIALSYDLFKEAMLGSFDRNDIHIHVQLSQLLENAAMVGAARLFDPVFWEQHKKTKQPL